MATLRVGKVVGDPVEQGLQVFVAASVGRRARRRREILMPGVRDFASVLKHFFPMGPRNNLGRPRVERLPGEDQSGSALPPLSCRASAVLGPDAARAKDHSVASSQVAVNVRLTWTPGRAQRVTTHSTLATDSVASDIEVHSGLPILVPHNALRLVLDAGR